VSDVHEEDDVFCETDGSREDLRFIGARSEAKQRLRRSRQSLRNTGCSRMSAPRKRVSGCQNSGGRTATNSPQSNWNEEIVRSGDRSGTDKRSGVSECDSGTRSGGYWQSNLDPSWSDDRSNVDLRRRSKFNRRAECSADKLQCDEDSRSPSKTLTASAQREGSRPDVDPAVSNGPGEVRVRRRCPFGYTSSSACSDVQKPDSRETLPKYKHSGFRDFICPSAADEQESRNRLTEGSCRDFVGNSPGSSFVPSCSEIDAGMSSMKRASNTDDLVADSSALRQRRSQMCGWAVSQAHPVIVTTDRPCEAFNNADAVDPSPDLAVRDPRHSSSDGPTRSFVSDETSSRRLSADEPAGSFNGADTVHNPPLGSSSRDLGRHPGDRIAAGCHVELDSPSSVSRHDFHFYSDCAECPQCLGYAICGACNTFHEPRDADHCSPLVSDLRHRDGLPIGSDPAAWDHQLSPCHDAELGGVHRDGPPAARSVQSMDLHLSVGRTSDEDGRGLSGAPASQPRTEPSASRVRLRSLHFYTDCADCADCCSSALCGSCCSVHGPAEEPADMSPRCAKRRDNDDRPYDVERVPGNASKPAENDSSQQINRLEHDAINASKPAENDSSQQIDHSPVTDGGDATGSPGTSQSSLLHRADVRGPNNTIREPESSSVADDSECWTTVEKTTCGCLVLLILVVFFAIYLQLTRRYFTGVY